MTKEIFKTMKAAVHYMTNNKKTARTAGIWYLAFILLGVFSVLFVDDTLNAAGNAIATIENINASMGLFIIGVIAYFAGYICYIFVVNTLGKLFKDTDSKLTMMMKLIVYLGVAVVLICKVMQVYAVYTHQSGFYTLYETGTAITTVFWGLWLLPLGLLILKSSFIPKTIGYLLLAACVTNLIDFTIHFFAPDTPDMVLTICYIVGMIAEFGLVLWLLVKGVMREKEH